MLRRQEMIYRLESSSGTRTERAPPARPCLSMHHVDEGASHVPVSVVSRGSGRADGAATQNWRSLMPNTPRSLSDEEVASPRRERPESHFPGGASIFDDGWFNMAGSTFEGRRVQLLITRLATFFMRVSNDSNFPVTCRRVSLVYLFTNPNPPSRARTSTFPPPSQNPSLETHPSLTSGSKYQKATFDRSLLLRIPNLLHDSTSPPSVCRLSFSARNVYRRPPLGLVGHNMPLSSLYQDLAACRTRIIVVLGRR